MLLITLTIVIRVIREKLEKDEMEKQPVNYYQRNIEKEIFTETEI